jgi:hypothetical protein
MTRRNKHAQTLARLRLMYQDARRSTELRTQEADAIRRHVISMRGGYRRAGRATLQATLAEQAAHQRIAAQAEQNLTDLAQRIADDDGLAGAP